MWESEDFMKIRKNSETGKKSGHREKIRNRISSCHIWWVNHPLCEVIWSKPLKSEYLRRIIKKTKQKKVIFKLRSFAHEVKMAKLLTKIQNFLKASRHIQNIQWNLSEDMLARTEKLGYSRKRIYQIFTKIIKFG